MLQDFHLQIGGANFHRLYQWKISAFEPSSSLRAEIQRPIIGMTLKNTEGVTVYATNTEMQSVKDMVEIGSAGTSVRIDIDFQCFLGSGDYFISVGVASRVGDDVIPHDRRYDAIHFQVISEGFVGF